MTRRVYVAIDPTDPPTDGEAVVYQSSSDSYIGSALGGAHDRSHDHSDADDGSTLEPVTLIYGELWLPELAATGSVQEPPAADALALPPAGETLIILDTLVGP